MSNLERDIEKELNQEYERFIEFGNLLDKRMRTYIVQYLQNKFEPDKYVIPELNEQYFQYFQKALDQIFLIDGILDLTKSNLRLKRQVILDTLLWLRKSYKDSKLKNPFQDEKLRLEDWAVTPLKIFVKRWKAMLGIIVNFYDRTELDYLFFEEKFEKLVISSDIDKISEEQRDKIESMIQTVLAQWDALLSAKILEFQLKKFKQEQEAYVELLEQKVDEYKKMQNIINPFTDYLGWDMSRKLWKQSSFDVLANYDELLKNEESVKALADLLGSMREAEMEIEEETFDKTIIRQEWVTDPDSKAEIVGIEESDSLTDMLSTEASLLSSSATETLFLKKYADKKLMTFKYEDRKLMTSEDHFVEINQKVRQKEKGPFIICVDTSESMYGKPELIAKVLTLAVLKMGMRENRKAYLINFSIGIKTFDLHDVANTIDDIAAFLNMSFYGGTDATLAMEEAIKQLSSNDYEDADVLMVSDFIMSQLNPNLLERVRHHQQNLNTQFHCLTIGSNANEGVLDIFDTNWIYDPKDEGIIRALTKGLKDINNRY